MMAFSPATCQAGKLNTVGACSGASRFPTSTVTRPKRAALVVRSVLASEAPPKAAGGQYANQLEALKSMSKVVADTGEIDSIREFKPIDCTTNPSLVLKAVQLPAYQHFLSEAIDQVDGTDEGTDRPYASIADALSVNMGCELLNIVPGRVSTEVDAHLSYDTAKTYEKALRLVDLYSKKGIDPSRLYIKMASTWEGIRACEKLQKEGIDCNLTLLFSFAQAAACADAGAALISPFVGRIMDWYKKKEGHDFTPHDDPGVKSVTSIYQYYKKYSYPTIVMAASFRNVGEIQELAGCDNITIAPALLGELAKSTDPLPRKLEPKSAAAACQEPRHDMTAEGFELFEKMHTGDQMAVDKLKEGIDNFASDQRKLEKIIADLMDKGKHKLDQGKA